MICYRDMVFCSGGTPQCKKFGTCRRALTPEVSKAAVESGLHIAQHENPTSLSCHSKNIHKPKPVQFAAAELELKGLMRD